MKKKPSALDELRWASHPKTRELQHRLKKLEIAAGAGIDGDRRVSDMKADNAVLVAKNRELVTRLERTEQSVSTLLALRSVKPAKYRRAARSKSSADATAVIVLSDWHSEETVKDEWVNGLNAFNLEIAEQRIRQTFNKALLLLEDARHLANIREVVVAALGDFISGHIHDDLIESNALAPLPATRFVKKHLSAGLDFLLEHADVDKLTVITARGNHGRTTHRMRSSTAADNSFEHDLYCDLASSYSSEPRIAWQISESYLNWLDIQGHPFRFHHGDAMRYQGGVGGITIPVLKAIAQWDRARRAYCDVFGHWHQWLVHSKFICNGSLIGYGPYSLLIKADYEHPRQGFFVVDKKYGITRAIPIFC